MPSNMLFFDTNLPQYSDETPTKQMVKDVHGYLFQLLEQLRYTLYNLDTGNWNETALKRFTGEITEPVYARITDTEGHLSELQLEADNLTVRISDSENNLSALQVKVNSITLGVTNGETSSFFQLKAGETILSSGEIKITGMVTFTDLSTEGRTIINGGNITTGTISAINIMGCTITGSTINSLSGMDGGFRVYFGSSIAPDRLVGGIRYDDRGVAADYQPRYRLLLYTANQWALQLNSATSIGLVSPGDIYLYSGQRIVLATSTDRAYPNIYVGVGSTYIPLHDYIARLVFGGRF